jgi:hypothetical protein
MKDLKDLDQFLFSRLQAPKERFLTVYGMLRAYPGASDERKKHVADMIQTRSDLKDAEKALVDAESSQIARAAAAVMSIASAAISLVRPESSLYDASRVEARHMSPGDFLAKLPSFLVEEPILEEAAKQIYQHITPKFRQQLHLVASKWAQYVAQFELGVFQNHRQREAAALEQQHRLKSREELLSDLQIALVLDDSSR